MLTVVFGVSTMSRTQVQLWYNRFKALREDVNDDDRLESQSTSTTDQTIEAVKKMIFDNHRITIRELAADAGISFVSMKHAAAIIILKQQNFEQKQRTMDIAQKMLTTFNGDPDLLKNVITGDESYVYGYDIKIKA